MDSADEPTLEELAAIVRRIAARELRTLDSLASMSDDDVKRLAILALVLQRSRPPATKDDPEAPTVTNEQLMRKAAQGG
jgi:hypothetical protein